METFDHLIIGGGISGTSAAEAIRARQPEATIAIIGAETHRLYSRVMLPHVLHGKSTEEKVFLRTENFYEQQRFTFYSGIAVTSVDPIARTVMLADGRAFRFRTALLIATGGDVRTLSCPGAESAEPMYFQTLDDMRRIAASSARTVLVYGGGFIAIEFHLSFACIGIRTIGAMRGEGFFSRVLDAHGRALVADEFKKRDIEIHFNTDIRGIERSEGVKKVFLSDGTEVSCDAVAAGIGLMPNIGFLAGSGITTNVGVVTDSHFRASVPGVFAAGDVAEHPDPWSGESRTAGNWQNAIFQGKVAGVNMAGGDESFSTLSSYSISCFGLPVAFVGAVEAGDAERVVRESANGSLQLVVKGGRVVGATNVGPFTERAALTKLITGHIELTSSMRQALEDVKTPLSSLIV